jgi:hypothetical protein
LRYVPGAKPNSFKLGDRHVVVTVASDAESAEFVVNPWKPSSPLTPTEAREIATEYIDADEIVGTSACSPGKLAADGRWVITCLPDRPKTRCEVTIDQGGAVAGGCTPIGDP